MQVEWRCVGGSLVKMTTHSFYFSSVVTNILIMVIV